MSVHCSDLPDGKYVAEIVEMKSTKSRKGLPMVEWRLRIVSGERAGEEILKKYYFSQDPEKAKKVKDFLLKECKLIGMHITSAAEFQAEKSKYIGTPIVIEAVTNEEDCQSFFVQGLDNAVTNRTKASVETDDDLGW